jgi:hypothetical protein
MVRKGQTTQWKEKKRKTKEKKRKKKDIEKMRLYFILAEKKT